MSSPAPPSTVSLITLAGTVGRGDAVVAAQGVDDQAVVGALGVGDVHLGRQPDDGDRGAGAEDVDDVVAVGAVDDHGVRQGIPCGAADDTGEVRVDLDHVGTGQVVHRGGVGPAQGVEVDQLDVVEVHDDVADVAGEPDPLTVGRRVEDLVSAAAVEQHRVGVVLALDHVAAVARIPLERVVAGAEQGDVVALLTVDEVVAIAAAQQVDAVAAEDRVAARTAVDGDLDQGREVAGRGESVVAGVGVDHQVLSGADVDRERCRVEAIEPDAGAVRRGSEHLGAAAAVDLGRVGPESALVEVGVIARVPDHPVIAALAEDLIVLVAAGEGVVLAAAEQEVEAALATEGVIPGLAE